MFYKAMHTGRQPLNKLIHLCCLAAVFATVSVGSDFKGKTSIVLHAAGIGLGFVIPWISIALYVLVSVMWFTPDRRIENVLREG